MAFRFRIKYWKVSTSRLASQGMKFDRWTDVPCLESFEWMDMSRAWLSWLLRDYENNEIKIRFCKPEHVAVRFETWFLFWIPLLVKGFAAMKISSHQNHIKLNISFFSFRFSLAFPFETFYSINSIQFIKKVL